MLPKSIYQFLPYFYIAVGLICILVVESKLIFFSSTLLIGAGALVLWMRRNNAVEPEAYIKSSSVSEEDNFDVIMDDNELPDHERRIDDERDFPLVDDDGVLIPFERRDEIPDNKA